MLIGATSLITGASTGIGRATAIELARHGSTVIITGRNVNGLLETKRLADKEKGEAIIIKADLSTVEGINHLIDKVKQSTKSLEHLINIAGIWHGKNEVYANKNFTSFRQ